MHRWRGASEKSPSEECMARNDRLQRDIRTRPDDGMREWVASPRSGDGIDPKEEKRQQARRQRKRKPDYSTQRLAKQVFDALCLGSSLTEIGLEDFTVTGVQPLGGSGQFLVEIQSVAPLSAFDPLEAEERLRLASGKIRFEIAGYLHRKRVPELKFRVIPSPADRQ
jgi:hypothetical protein